MIAELKAMLQASSQPGADVPQVNPGQTNPDQSIPDQVNPGQTNPGQMTPAQMQEQLAQAQAKLTQLEAQLAQVEGGLSQIKSQLASQEGSTLKADASDKKLLSYLAGSITKAEQGLVQINGGIAPPVRPVRELERLRARVELVYDGGVPAEAAEKLRALLTGESVVIQKRTKHKSLADVDIRPMLHTLDIQAEGDRLVLLAEVSAQNPGLNPALLASALSFEAEAGDSVF